MFCSLLGTGQEPSVFRLDMADGQIFLDEWGCSWVFIAGAGGSMLMPGIKPVVPDVRCWEKYVKFPDLAKMDFDSRRESFLANEYDPSKVFVIDVGQGCTERLVALMGGYKAAMLAFADAPKACREFFNAFADWMIAFF
jgi:hypothetical protein